MFDAILTKDGFIHTDGPWRQTRFVGHDASTAWENSQGDIIPTSAVIRLFKHQRSDPAF